jgi:hypothetical protein
MFRRFKDLFGQEDGQSTTEYALVLLAVVAIAGVLSKVGVSGMTEFLTGVFAKLAAGVK